MRRLAWYFLVMQAIGFGLYPLMFLLTDMSGGLLSTKPATLLENQAWQFFFYLHIIAGGLALLIGWSQFSTGIRRRWISFHRLIGRVYLVAVLLSGFSGLFIARYATGVLVASLGFSSLAICWLGLTGMGYHAVRQRRIASHHGWMIRSYCITCAAVTLRFWIPLFSLLEIEFAVAYPIISWLSWVPNLLVDEWLVRLHADTTHR